MAFSNGVYSLVSNTWTDATAGTVINPDHADAHHQDLLTALNLLSKGGVFATTDVASGATCNIMAAATGYVRITGSTGPITSLGSTANTRKHVLFASTPTITHNATTLILPSGADITAAAGDTATFVSDGSGNVRCIAYQRAALAPGTATATAVTVANEASDTTCFPLFVTAATGDLAPKSNANLAFNSSTGVLTLTAPVLGTPTSGTLTNCTGLPVSTGISGLGTGVATFLATPSSANLISAVTDETGTGALVFANTPTLVTPVLGTPTSGTLTNCTGLPVSSGISGLGTGVATFLATPSSANLISAVTDETGTGALVFANTPTLVTPVLGTPTSGTLTNCTGLPISTGVSGLGTGVATFLATPSSANLASAVTDETGSGALVFGTSPTLTTPRIADAGFIADANGNEQIIFTTTASAVNELTLANAATGNNPKITASGGDANVGIDFQAKATGVYRFLSTASQASEIRLFEDTDDGTSYIAIKAAAMAGNVTLTLPADDGNSNQFLKTDGSGVLSWADPAGGGTVTNAANLGDDKIIRGNGGTTGVQDSGITIDDSNNVSGMGTLSSGTITTSGSIELGHASDTTLSRSAAGVLAVEGVVVKNVGKETIWVPAAAMTARTTNGAASGVTELATNDVMLRTFDFDQTTEEGVAFMIAMPKSWNESTVTFIPYWTGASGTGDVVWQLAGGAFSNDDAMDAAYGTGQNSTDSIIAANDCHIGPESSAITIAGTPAEGDLVSFLITREVGDAGDTLNADAKLIGIKLFVTTNAATDA